MIFRRAKDGRTPPPRKVQHLKNDQGLPVGVRQGGASLQNIQLTGKNNDPEKLRSHRYQPNHRQV
jgi:hypothetical protein